MSSAAPAAGARPLSLARASLTRLRVVRSMRGYAAGQSYSSCRDARARGWDARVRTLVVDLHAAAQPQPLRRSIGSHVRGRWTIAIRQRSTTRRDGSNRGRSV